MHLHVKEPELRAKLSPDYTIGCTNWYLTDEGKNTNNWSGLTLSYRKTTQKINLHDYHQVGS